MSTYRWIADDIHSPSFSLSAWMMIEMAGRIMTQYGDVRPHRWLLHTAAYDAEYCIDAPREMPAGGCVREQIDDDTFMPVQLRAERE